MDEQQLATFRQRLLDERERLTAHSEDLPTQISDGDDSEDFGVTNHPADAATDVFLRERNAILNSNSEEIVGEIDDALQRIEDGTYGICERTGKPIEFARLEALPYARYSLEGQKEVEQERNL